jgi:RHS repeat-associated protein
LSVALVTGEAALMETDAVDTQAGLGRSFSSFSAATRQTGPFGPGWSATLLAPGEASAELVDHRTQDHTLVVVTAGGGSQVFTPVAPDAVVSDPVPVAVELRPAGTDDGSRITLDPPADHDGDPNTAPTSRATLRRPLGPVTVWEHTTDAGWAPVTATGSAVTADAPEAGFASDETGYPTWIAQTQPGDAATCTEIEQATGCRGLKVGYTGAVSDPDRRVTRVERVTAGEPTVNVATYHYNLDGELDRVCGQDPDDDPTNAVGPLCVSYTYTAVAGRTLLETLTPPGQTPWTFHYDATGRLEQVTRPETTGTVGGDGTATWTVRYHLPLTTPGLPDLTVGAAAQWGQEQDDLPATAASVFSPARVPATSPTVEDLKYASVWFYDAEGTTTNTAAYGAGAWLVDTSWYDTHGNVIRSLDGAGRAHVLAQPVEDQPAAAQAASTVTVYNDDPTTEKPGEGTRVEEEYGPAHEVTLQDGTDGVFRSRTEYVYDDEPEGANLGGAKPADWDGQTTFDLVVEARHSAVDLTGTESHDLTIVRNDYDPVVARDGNGWDLGMPTRVKTQLEDGTWSTQVTRYDAEGRQIETRQPGGATNPDGSGADAHAVITRYYTKNDPASQAACKTDGDPERASWVGLVCTTGPAAQPTGESMPVTHYRAFDAELRPVEILETSGTNADGSAKVARTTTTSYDNLGRPVTTTITAGGDTRTSTIDYAAGTGLATGVSGSGDPVTTGFDSWGRVTSYTDGTGMTSTTRYTPEGDIATFDDGEGTYTYSYRDAAAGEYRPLPASVDVGLAAGAPDEFRLAYNAAGAQTTVTYPNGMTADYGYTDAGVPTSLEYTDATGTGLLGFTATVDADGRVHGYTSDASRQDYTFDNLGRLTTTRDYRVNPVTDLEECTTRSYGFSSTSERTSYQSSGPATDGSCQTAAPAVAKTNSYDRANRITNPGYSYDNLGRTLTTPAADTTPDATGPLSAAYHANDMIKSLTQTVSDGAGGTLVNHVDYSLDATGRINTITSQTNGAETRRLRYRYSDSNDSPSSIRETTDGGATWTTIRYLTIPGIGMAASVTANTITYQLANLHGAVVATSSSTGPMAIDQFSEHDEYGNAAGSTTPARFRWLGVHERSSDTVAGLVLMGVRLYNPTTGLFLTPDPILGGNVTPYTYPTDPINNLDLDGRFSQSTWRRIAGVLGKAAAVADLAFFCGPCQTAAIVLGVGQVVALWKARDGRAAARAAVGILLGSALGRVRTAISRGIGSLEKPMVAVFGNRQGRDMVREMRYWLTGGYIFTLLAEKFPAVRELV